MIRYNMTILRSYLPLSPGQTTGKFSSCTRKSKPMLDDSFRKSSIRDAAAWCCIDIVDIKSIHSVMSCLDL